VVNPASANPQKHRQADSAPESRTVVGADGAADDLLGGGGETVEIVAGDHEEVHQDGVGGQRHRAELRAGAGEQRKAGQQREGADHDVAVDRDEAQELGRSKTCAHDGARARSKPRMIHQKPAAAAIASPRTVPSATPSIAQPRTRPK
jgi:hypothetical protein